MKSRTKELHPTLKFVFWAILAIILLWILILSGNSFFNTWKLQRRVALLEKETLALKAVNDSLSAENNRLKTDPETAEKAAREKFGLTKPDETVFRFVPAEEEDDKSKK